MSDAKALVERLETAAHIHTTHPCEAYGMSQLCFDARALIRSQEAEIARLKDIEAERDQLRVSIVDLDRVVDQLDIANTTVDPAEEILELQNRLVAAEARLSALVSARGCDVEGALRDYWPQWGDFGKEWCGLQRAKMSAALAVGVAPVRAKLMEIADCHLGDCPTTHDELGHALAHINRLRKMAYVAATDTAALPQEARDVEGK